MIAIDLTAVLAMLALMFLAVCVGELLSTPVNPTRRAGR
jgi:hypothetical protein